MSEQAAVEKHGFQAETRQILDLVIHSLYSHKEIFLRELISNASDALDKLRFQKLRDSSLSEGDGDLKIRVDYDEKANTVTVTDNGIAMSREQAMEHLGTIANSGTKQFLESLSGDQAKDANLIGQFGVGFYASFIVADKITVNSRGAGLPADQGVCWESDGKGEYTVKTINKADRGTEVILHLKKDEKEFLDNYRLRNIISKYSDHISWPIEMEKPVVDEEDKKEKKFGGKLEYEIVNKAKALWIRNKSDISDEEYREFYKHISHDFEDPMAWTHNRVEGKQDYTSLLYIPTRAPFDLWQPEVRSGLKLFVKRVFVMDDADQFIPRYLRFVKGVIDSSDLPLNVSREILQDNKQVEIIRSACVKRVLGLLEKMAENDKEKYAEFWKTFGLVLKEGPIEDFANKDKIAKLLRFATTHDDKEVQTTALADYVSRMKEGQDKIYYIAADSFNAAKASPHLEIFRKKGIEVVLLYDRVDEWLINHLSEFDGKHLQSIAKGELDLGDLGDEEDKAAQEEKSKSFESVVKQVTDVLGEKVKEVRVTHRLTESPACVVADTHDMGLEMQRIMQAAGQQMPPSKPIFEINPDHGLIQRLQSETDDDRFTELAHVLFDQAMLAESGHLENPAEFVQRLNKILLES